MYTWNPTGGAEGTGAWNTTPTAHSRYMWFGWMNLLELDALASNAYLRRAWAMRVASKRSRAAQFSLSRPSGTIADPSGASGTPNVGESCSSSALGAWHCMQFVRER